MRSWIGDGNYLVHRTQTVDYQELKGLPLVALIWEDSLLYGLETILT